MRKFSGSTNYDDPAYKAAQRTHRKLNDVIEKLVMGAFGLAAAGGLYGLVSPSVLPVAAVALIVALLAHSAYFAEDARADYFLFGSKFWAPRSHSLELTTYTLTALVGVLAAMAVAGLLVAGVTGTAILVGCLVVVGIGFVAAKTVFIVGSRIELRWRRATADAYDRAKS